MALAVSITADAGQDASAGTSISPLAFRAATMPSQLVPLQGPSAWGGFGRPRGEATGSVGEAVLPQGLWQAAGLALGESEDFQRLSEEIEPRALLKRDRAFLPAVDRSGKSDPFVGVRPTFDMQLRHPGGLASLRAAELVFSFDETSPVGGFALFADEGEDAPSEPGFEPWPDGENPTTVHSFTEISPQGAEIATMTMRPASLHERLMQGATPAVDRATALGSATPAPADSTPIEIAASPAFPPLDEGQRPLRRPRRAASAAPVEADNSSREQRCLAEAIYFEARSESPEGQAAVAQVVLNRVASGLYPATICGVVYQNRHRYKACQFSFACEGKSLRITERDAWRTAVRIAKDVTSGRTYVSHVGGSTHYHANYVQPRWARQLEKMDVIGHHIFYKLRPGRS